jgi:aryl-alcohol dehydrogenase-like predicted oxidoreductase
MKRREFVKKTALTAGSLVLGKMLGDTPEILADQHKKSCCSKNPPILPRRNYGKTDVKLSIIGFGGIVVMNAEQKQANQIVAEAVEKGVNYFDVAPSYGDAEIKLGPALKPYRKKVFLACKTGQRQREAAAAELKQSLQRLHTDHLDLYQLHGITDVKKDVDAAFAQGGAMEVFINARKSGQVRFLGFSAHSIEAALTAMDRFDFDSILFPINFACYYKGKFGSQVVAQAQSQGVARLALKTLARQQWPKDDPQRQKYSKCWYQPLTDPEEAKLGLKFTLSQPITAAIPPGEASLFRMALDLALKFEPISRSELNQLEKLSASLNPIFRRPEKEA